MSEQIAAGLEVVTAQGGFRVRLRHDAAPATCVYFSDLVGEGSLDGSSVFRIVTPENETPDEHPIRIVQLGLRGDRPEDRTTVPHESTQATGLRHRQWTVSAARFDLGELYGSFFICLRDEPCLDFGGARNPDGYGFAAFGNVVSGFDTVWRLLEQGESSPMLVRPIAVMQVRHLPKL